MSGTRINHTDAQIQLAVDYIAEHFTIVSHPEDNDINFFNGYDRIEKKVAGMSDEERSARLARETQYLENFKIALRNYLQANRTCLLGVASDYDVADRNLLGAIKGTHVHLRGGFWSVNFCQDGTVSCSRGKYGMPEKIQPTANNVELALEELTLNAQKNSM